MVGEGFRVGVEVGGMGVGVCVGVQVGGSVRRTNGVSVGTGVTGWVFPQAASNEMKTAATEVAAAPGNRLK